MERYEFNEGGSNKFWEVAVAGPKLVVRYGKIGASGQVKEKAFPNATAAESEKRKLVSEKTGKGYVAAGASPLPPPEQPPAAPAAAKAEPPAAPIEPEAAKVDPPPAPVEPPAAVRREAPVLAVLPSRLPEDDVLLFNRPAPPTRTRPAPRRTAAEARAILEKVLREWATKLKKGEDFVEERLRAADVERFTTADAVNWLLKNEPLLVPDCKEAAAECLADGIVAARGAEFGLRVVAHYTQHYHAVIAKVGMRDPDVIFNPSRNIAARAFRRAITSVDEREFSAALAFALKVKSQMRRALDNAYLCHALADDGATPHALQPAALLAEAEAQAFDAKRDGASLWSLIVQAPPSKSVAWRERCPTGWDGDSDAAALVVETAKASGESPLPLLLAPLASIFIPSRSHLLEAALDTRQPEALRALLTFSDEFHAIRDTLNEAARAYPTRFFEMLVGAMSPPRIAALPATETIRKSLERAAQDHPAYFLQRILAAQTSSRPDPLLDWLAARIIGRDGVETARVWAAAVGERAEIYLAKLVGSADAPVATSAALPSFLRAPPWRAKKAPRKDIVIEVAPRETPIAYHGKAPPPPSKYELGNALESAADVFTSLNTAKAIKPGSLDSEILPTPGDSDEAIADWMMRNRERLGVFRLGQHSEHHWILGVAPLNFEALALRQWTYLCDNPDTKRTGTWRWKTALPRMLARFGEKAAPDAIRLVAAHTPEFFPALAPLDAPGVAPIAARAFATMKRLRQPALAWLRAHPRTALMALLPAAVGPPGEARDHVEFVARWFKINKPEALDAAIAEYAPSHPQFVEAINQVLERDPFARTPSRVGKLPDWLALVSLPRPELKSGGALPDEALTALLEMCTFVKSDDLYPGVPALRELCTSKSLGAFAWALFEQWLLAGAPAKDPWAFRALGWFGDDHCARELTRLIRKWPGEAAHARAVTGLDVLADIGSDVALLNLNGVAEKVKFKGLQDRAKLKIEELADARDLSPEDLADRLAPDFDLDARGGLDLDFGPRRFRVGFDEFLRPWVKDADGKRLKDLPKPLKSDDEAKAAAASASWSALKKDVRIAASVQLRRLEILLASGRRLKPDVFETYFAAHPLIRHLTQRLVWGVYETSNPDAPPRLTFRVADDLSLSDAHDNPADVDLSPNAKGLIGLAHPLHLGAEALAAWSALFGDYEIAQPFPQLGRETHALTEDEKAGLELKRFEGKIVDSKRLRGLASRAWRLGPALDGGGISTIDRAVTLTDGETVSAELGFEEGLWAGSAADEPKTQTLRALTLGEWQSRAPIGALGAVAASEILRDVTLLVAAGVG